LDAAQKRQVKSDANISHYIPMWVHHKQPLGSWYLVPTFTWGKIKF